MNLRDRLEAWASWGRSSNIGYPKMSPMFGERSLKTPLYAPSDCSDDILEIESAVCGIAPEDRRVIVLRYQWRLTVRELARRLHVSRGTAWRRIENAEGAVYHLLCRGT